MPQKKKRIYAQFHLHLPERLTHYFNNWLTMSVLNADDRSRFSIIFKILQIYIFILDSTRKMHSHIYINKPIIGSEVEITSWIFQNIQSNLISFTLNSCQCGKHIKKLPYKWVAGKVTVRAVLHMNVRSQEINLFWQQNLL